MTEEQKWENLENKQIFLIKRYICAESGKNRTEIYTKSGNFYIEKYAKSGNNVKSTSLNLYMKENKPKYAIRISSKNFGFENNIKSVPLYAAFLI